MNSVKACGPEAKIAMGVNLDTSQVKNGQNKKSCTKIFIGNIQREASMEKIEKFLGEVDIISFKLMNKKNQSFALVNLPNALEAEKAVKIYNNKEFMGHKLVVSLVNNQKKNWEILSEMPKLEDIDDDEITSQCDSIMNMTCADKKICFEDSLNIQPDSNGLFSLRINKKNSFISEKEVMEKLSPFGPISNIYFSSNSVVVKMPSKQQVINCFKVLSKELNMSIGDNSVKRNDNKMSSAKIYIGNIATEASRENILRFLGDVKIISFKLINKKTKVFAFADLLNIQEAEKAIELYNNIIFMGHKLVIRLADNQNNKVSSILGEMPQLEDIEDDYNDSVNAFNSDDNLSSKSCNSKRMFTLMPNLEDIEPEKIDSSSNSKNSFEDSLNIQPDSNGLFSLCINKTDSYLKSKAVIEQIFSQYGTISSVSFSDDAIVIKMPSRQQAINSFKDLGQELNMSIGNNSVVTNTEENHQNGCYAKIYIGNIAVKAPKAKILKFLGDVKIISFKLINKKTKAFAFADLFNIQEAEKAIKLYNNIIFMGHKLVVRFANDQNKVSSILGEMPQLEDIEDDYDDSVNAFNSDDSLSSKSCNSKRMFTLMPNLEDIEPEKIDSSTNGKNSYTFSGSYNNKITSSILVNDLTANHDNCTLKQNGHSTEQVTLFVGNFPIGMSQGQLLSLFKDFHPSSVHIINNQNSKRSTQALVYFPNQKESQKAIYKFDKASYENSILLVTSIGFCPCLGNQKSERINKASSFNTSTPESLCNGSSSPNKKPEYQISPTVNHHYHHHHQQQQGNNSQPTNSLTNGNTNQKSSIKFPQKNSLRMKMLLDQMKEENQQLTISPIDESFKSEAVKMAILIKKFQIPPNLSSSDTFQVMVTSVINNELFWGNIFYSDKDLREFMVLHNELQTSALGWPKYVLLKKEMKCIALYQGEWYRAWVLDSIEEDVVEVFFLDYGNVSQVKLEDVKSPSESIWKLLPKARVFKIASNSKKLPPNAENQLFDIKICHPGNMTNDYIAVASLVSH